MYNKSKKFIVLLFVFLCLVNQTIMCCAQTQCVAYDSDIKSNIELAQQYLEKNFKNIKEMLCIDGQEYYQLSPQVIDDLEIANPYIIYKVGDVQDEIYYFPIVLENNVVLIISVFRNINSDWSFSISTNLIEELNEINYMEYDFIFYEYDEHLYIENDNILYIDGVEREEQSILQGNSVKEKEKILIENYEVNETNELFEGTVETSPEYSAYQVPYTIQLLTEPYVVSQGMYSNCWAASVATIVNYRKSMKSLTAKAVCDKINIGYNDGGDIYDKQKALKQYGYSYNYIRNSQLTWSQIWSNLNAKWPIAMSTFSNNSGHALTLVGCRNARGLYYITVWNSATNSYETIQYISDGKTTYMMNNAIYTWTKSLSYK